MHNAINYGRDGGQVDIGVERLPRAGKPDRFSIVIRDHGPGIAEEHLPRLTERFYRVNAAPSRVHTREPLLNAVWGRDVYIDERTVDVHVGRLRKAINPGQLSDPIRTVRGAGYAFNETFGTG